MATNHLELHERAVKICREHRRLESRLISALQEIDRYKTFKKLGHASLFLYCVSALGLSESVAYAFIIVGRKAAELEALQTAIVDEKLSVTRASRIASVLTAENAACLIEFARTHSARETEAEIARLRPRKSKNDSVKHLDKDMVYLGMSVSTKTLTKLKRIQSLLASKGVEKADFEAALDASFDVYLMRNDPVEKAQRAQKRAPPLAPIPEKLCSNKVPARTPLTAAEKHAVFARDGGRCTHVDARGQRCPNDRWLEAHHIVHVSQGGSNHPSNLTLLCSFHHELAHQLSFGIEGQVSWIRETRLRYQ